MPMPLSVLTSMPRSRPPAAPTRVIVALVLLLAVAAAACAADPELVSPDDEATPTAGAEPSAAPTDPPTVGSTPEPTAEPAEPTAEPAEPTLEPTAEPTAEPEAVTLRVDGFGPLEFGDDAATTEATAEATFGPPLDTGTNTECGEGPTTFLNYDGFILNINNGVFAGWTYDSPTAGYATPSGITVGVPTSQLTETYVGVDISDTTLGTEFFYEVPSGFIGGFIGDADTVVMLYAGVTCFFR